MDNAAQTMVRSEDTPDYRVNNHADDQLIAQALDILRRRATRGNAMTSPRVVKEYLMLSEPDDGREHFRIIWLDAQYRIINVESHATGTTTQAAVYPREVVRSAIKHNAAACILTHNHPSGSNEPSQADIKLTKALKTALALVDTTIIDHVVTAHGTSMSFAERGIL